MGSVRSLGTEFRLQTYTFEGVHRDFRRAAIDVEEAATFSDGKKIQAGHVLNAVVLGWMAMSREDRIKLVRQGISLLEEAQDRDQRAAAGRTHSTPVPVDVKVRHVRGEDSNGGGRRKAVGRKKLD